MALNTFKCNSLTPLHFKGLKYIVLIFTESLGIIVLMIGLLIIVVVVVVVAE